MAITAQEVNKLRQMTGAGMMDCKKALVEAEGDFDKAIELLRKKGQKVSASRADRETNEGVVFVKTNADNTTGVVVAFSCETDFVAKNEEFIALGNDLEMDVIAYEVMEGETIVPYIHAGGKLGVLVSLKNTSGVDVTAAGKDVAMQIAAMNPLALDKDGVDASVIEKEIEIGKDQARQEGKPEAMLEKIALGKLNKFYKENTLLSQAFVKDNKSSIAQYLDGVSKGLTVAEFKRIAIG